MQQLSRVIAICGIFSILHLDMRLMTEESHLNLKTCLKEHISATFSMCETIVSMRSVDRIGNIVFAIACDSEKSYSK